MPPHRRALPPGLDGCPRTTVGRRAGAPTPARRVCFLLSLTLAATPDLGAQESSAVTGVVVDAQSGEPVPDVVVGVDGMALLTYTDSAGYFRIDGVPSGSRSFMFRHLAYGEHTRDVEVAAGGDALELEVRISREAIELSPLVVDVLSEAERAQLASGSPLRELRVEEIQEGQRQGLRLTDLLRRVPGIRFRPIGGGVHCIEYRTYGTGDTCRELTLVMDGVRMGGASMLLETMDLDEIERLEVLSPAEAGMQYGIFSGFGVLLIETRTGPSPAGLDRVGPMSFFDWSVEGRPYPWWRVFATSFLTNAAIVGLASAPLAYCSHFLDGSLSRQERCNPWVAAGTGVVAVAVPGATTGAVGSWAGATPISIGSRGWSMSLATLSNWAGALLFFASRSSDSTAGQIVGLGIVGLGTPLVVTLSDRYFRRRR